MTANCVPAPAEHTHRRGILWMLLTVVLFVAMDTTAKKLSQSYAVPQIVWARYAFHLLLVILILRTRVTSVVSSRRIGLQLMRSALMLCITFLFFQGLKRMPLADANAVMAIAPVLITALSVPLLGEAVGPRRWLSVVAGLTGALIIIRPGIGTVQLAALFPLGAAFCYALYQVTTRMMSQSDPPMTTLFFTAFIGAVVMSAWVPFHWTAPDATGWILMAMVGAFGGLSHFSLIKALQAAPASTVAPFSYTNLLWSVPFGFFVFGDLPDAWTVFGAAFIVGSGLYIYRRERVLRGKAS